MRTDVAMQYAWLDKTNMAFAAYRQALSAPALFKPEYVDELREEFERTQVHLEFWQK